MEEKIITQRLNPHIDPVLDVWQWQVPVYLFLGGLTAGLLVLGAWHVLAGRSRPGTAPRLLAGAPFLLALGMLALFLDLAYKVHVWRFYTAFQVTSPMSWGSWILLLVLPANVLLVAATLPESFPDLYARAVAGRLRGLVAFAGRHVRRVALATLVLGVALGVYTGVLLSAYVARPFWNTSLLGLLFLTSGLSSAAALVQLASRDAHEQHRYTVLDLALVGAELFLIGLMVFGLATGAAPQQQAARLVLGGTLTAYFWVFVVGVGLLLPAALEVAHLRGRPLPRALAPALVLLGGLVFRFFIVEAGQLTAWTGY
jgi:protein NrfD